VIGTKPVDNPSAVHEANNLQNEARQLLSTVETAGVVVVITAAPGAADGAAGAAVSVGSVARDTAADSFFSVDGFADIRAPKNTLNLLRDVASFCDLYLAIATNDANDVCNACDACLLVEKAYL